MKRVSLLGFVFPLFLSRPALATNFCGTADNYNPYCTLMTALGQCAPPNNPYKNGMRALFGNDMQIDSSSQPATGVVTFQLTVTRDSGLTLKQNMGMLQLRTEMVGVGPSAKLKCSLKVTPVRVSQLSN